MAISAATTAGAMPTSMPSSANHHLPLFKKRLNAPANKYLLNIRGGFREPELFPPGEVGVSKTQHPEPPETNKIFENKRLFFRRGMYSTCITTVLLWIIIGTLTYAHLNSWPLATSFFYAVDAGMSIGFCTDVAETTRKSRAFSVVYILAGASVVAGALALFVEDTLEGASVAITSQYRSMLENNAFQQADVDNDGYLDYNELKELLFHLIGSGNNHNELISTDEKMEVIWSYLDPYENGSVSRKALERAGLFERNGTEALLQDLMIDIETKEVFSKNLNGTDAGGVLYKSIRRPSRRRRYRGLRTHKKSKRKLLPRAIREVGSNRMFLVFFCWIAMGITWGMTNQKWDIITATHFAISALATGGLTAPPATEEGTLPDAVALFVGWYCLLGIPLFYTGMAHFAKIMVEKYLVEADQIVVRTPLQPAEFEFAKHLCSYQDDYMHLSDFIVLYFLRRSKTNTETIELLRRQFELLDKDGDGALTFEEATAGLFLDNGGDLEEGER